MDTERQDATAIRQLGSDRVLLRGDRLAIESSVAMEHWEVRRYRQTLVRFEGRPWRIVRRSAGHTLPVRYELVPWSPGPLDAIGHEIDYGADFVRERDRDLAERRRRTRLSTGLWLLLPLIGFLGSGSKQRLQERYGIDPVAATRASLCVEAAVLLVTAVLLTIGTVVAVAGVAIFDKFTLLLVALACALDMLFRYHSVLGEARYPPGLFQWLLRRHP